MGNNKRRSGRLDDQNKKLWALVKGWADVSPTPQRILNMGVTPPQHGASRNDFANVRVIAQGKNIRDWLRHCLDYGKDNYPGREEALASFLNKVGFVGLFNVYVYI